MELSTSRRRALELVRPHPYTHPGLWMDRYLLYQTGDPRNESGDKATVDEARSTVFRQVAACKVPAVYREALRQRVMGFYDIQGEQRHVEVFAVRCAGRFVVGLGQKGVVEAGCTLDRTWGVPVLPGASLKGVASSAAHLLTTDPAWRRPRTDDEDDGESARYLFGTTERAGDVVFHDAWWIPDDSAHGGALKTPLKADVMTVHHPDYYQPTGSDGRKLLAPDGMQSPVPISFLSATGTFLVALEGDDEGWVKAARELLLLGLEHLGIGAKTSSGYGRFGPTEDPWLESERTRIKEEVLRAAEDRKAANAPPEMRARLHAERRLADEGAPSFLKDAHAEMHRDVATPSPEDVATWLAIADVLDAKIEKFTGLGTQYQLKSLAENLRTKAGVESAKAVSSEVETVKPGALVTSWVNAWTRAKRPGAKALGNAVSVKEDQVKVKASQWQKFATEAFPSACPADYVPTAEVVDAIAAVLGDAAQAWREWATQP